jgi:hypothetical protein
MLRTWAIWRRDLKVGILLVTILCAGLGIAAYGNVMFNRELVRAYMMIFFSHYSQFHYSLGCTIQRLSRLFCSFHEQGNEHRLHCVGRWGCRWLSTFISTRNLIHVCLPVVLGLMVWSAFRECRFFKVFIYLSWSRFSNLTDQVGGRNRLSNAIHRDG